MTSSAISAQGSTLALSTGTPAASVNLSSATVSTAGPTLLVPGITTFVTSAAHGLPNGSQVVMAALTGTGASLINGVTFAISVISTTSFSIQLNTFGLTLVATSGTVVGTLYAQLGNLKTYNGLDGQASEIDVTNLSSSAKEIRLGLVDFGQVQIEMDLNLADVGQARAQVQYVNGQITPCILTLPNGNTASFNAFVRKFSMQGGVDQVVKRQLDLRVSGPVTWC